jgi:hypothetical protein
MQQNENLKSLKEIEAQIKDKKLVEKAKKLKTIPSDSNEFTKVCEMGDTSFLMDFEKQDEMLGVFLTKKEIENSDSNDLSLLASYAYEWVYGFEDEEGKFKITPNTTDVVFEFKRKDVNSILGGDEEILYKALGLKKEDLTTWERSLITAQAFRTIYAPMRTTMGLVSKRF